MEQNNKMDSVKLQEEIEKLREPIGSLTRGGVVLFVLFMVIGIGAGINAEQLEYAGAGAVATAVIVCTILMLAAGFCWSKAEKRKRKIKDLLGTNIIHGILDEFFNIEIYDKSGGMSADDLRATGLVPNWKKSSGTDYVRGTYDSIPFEFADMHLFSTRRSVGGESTETVTHFKGLWLIFGFEGENGAKLTISENSGNYSQGERCPFDVRFSINADDPYFASLILTPEFASTIEGLSDHLQRKIKLCFEQFRVHVAIPGSVDLFEFGTKENDLKDLDALKERFRNELAIVINLMETMRSNKHLYK